MEHPPPLMLKISRNTLNVVRVLSAFWSWHSGYNHILLSSLSSPINRYTSSFFYHYLKFFNGCWNVLIPAIVGVKKLASSHIFIAALWSCGMNLYSIAQSCFCKRRVLVEVTRSEIARKWKCGEQRQGLSEARRILKFYPGIFSLFYNKCLERSYCLTYKVHKNDFHQVPNVFWCLSNLMSHKQQLVLAFLKAKTWNTQSKQCYS